MVTSLRRFPIVWTLVILALVLSACNLPSADAPQVAIPSPQLTATPLPQGGNPTLPAPTRPAPTLTPTTPKAGLPTLAPTPPANPTPVPSLTPLYKGVIAYDLAQETIQGYDFSGKPLGIKMKATGAGWIQGQWANNSIYYLKTPDKTVIQMANGGAAQKLSFIPAKDGLSFVISPDGKKIAWSFMVSATGNPASELWIANIDGAGAKKIAQVDSAANTKWLVLKPYRWLPDGRLLYVDEPTGIGGYILFSGFAGIHLYDPASGKQTNLTPGQGAGGMCLKEISPDFATVLSICAVSGNQTLAYVNLANNQVTAIPMQADQSQAGSPAYSPSGSWLAYAYARANPDNESGKVAVLQSGTTEPKILANLNKGYFNVKTWINANQFIVQRYEGELSSIWLFNRDGSAPVKLADGMFVSVVP